MKDAFIFDIDMTLADNRHRDHLLPFNIHSDYHKLDDKEKTKLWEHYHSHLTKDTVIQSTVDILKSLSNRFQIILATGRSRFCSTITCQWLKDNNIPYNAVVFREDGDFRCNAQVKESILSSLSKYYSIKAIFEDDPNTASHLRSLGYVVYHIVL